MPTKKKSKTPKAAPKKAASKKKRAAKKKAAPKKKAGRKKTPALKGSVKASPKLSKTKLQPAYKKDKTIPVCYNCHHYKRSDSTCHEDSAFFLPTRNDSGPLYDGPRAISGLHRTRHRRTPTGAFVEGPDNPAIWACWPRCTPDDFCGRYALRTTQTKKRPD